MVYGGTTTGNLNLQGTVSTVVDMTLTADPAATFTLADTGVSGTKIASVLFKSNKAQTITISSLYNGVLKDGTLTVAYQFAFETGGVYALGSAVAGATLTSAGTPIALAKTAKAGVTYNAYLWIAANAAWDAGVFVDTVTISVSAT
jgi:hypothetical protein